MKTRADVIVAAFRTLGIAAVDDDLTADQEAYGGGLLDALLLELVEQLPALAPPLGVTASEAVFQDDRVFIPLSQVLAADVAPAYGASPVIARSRAWHRLMQVLRPDDRTEDTPSPADYGRIPDYF